LIEINPAASNSTSGSDAYSLSGKKEEGEGGGRKDWR
jgi:hypothetical protein